MSLLVSILSFIHFLGFLWRCVLAASFHVGKIIYLAVEFMLDAAWKAVHEVVIIGNDFYEFLCRLNADISSAMFEIHIWFENRFWYFLVHVYDQLLHTVKLLLNISCADISHAMACIKELFFGMMRFFEDLTLFFLELSCTTCCYGYLQAVVRAIPWLALFIVLLSTAIPLIASLYQSLNLRQFLDGLLDVGRLFCFRLGSMFRARIMPTSLVATRGTEDMDECLSDRSCAPIDELDVPMAQSCVVCRERLKCVLLLPCRHLCLCIECSDYMTHEGLHKYCPLCRTPVVQSLSVYV